ncbi:hypothetical protein BgiBS90_021397, partial [Biomphalaria glabrata]
TTVIHLECENLQSHNALLSGLIPIFLLSFSFTVFRFRDLERAISSTMWFVMVVSNAALPCSVTLGLS